MAIAFSAILYRLAAVSPSTGAFLRCAFAVPVLAVLAGVESARLGRRPARMRIAALAAGAFLGLDLVLWHRAIEDVGAGLATVLGNVQVVIVGLLAWWFFAQRPASRFFIALPVVILGVVLVSGVVGARGYGSDPARGVIYGTIAGVSYSGFLLLLGRGGTDRRRLAGPLCDATIAAAAVAGVLGLALRDLDLHPAWPGWAWLVVLALTSQVLGWLLISVSLPLLPPSLSSVLLTLQPVGSVALAAVIFGESPSAAQLGGAAVILAAVVLTSTARRAREPAVAPAPA